MEHSQMELQVVQLTFMDGYNGGGNASQYGNSGGGGGTDIRIGENSLYNRVIVAGGGGRRSVLLVIV